MKHDRGSLRSVGSALVGADRRAVAIIRWRFGVEGPPETISVRHLEWSADGVGGNRRNALIMGVAAAETAVKHAVATLEPRSGWLGQNTASPPIVPMLENYLPELAPPPHLVAPKKARRVLQDAVEARNQLVHRPNGVFTARRAPIK